MPPLVKLDKPTCVRYVVATDYGKGAIYYYRKSDRSEGAYRWVRHVEHATVFAKEDLDHPYWYSFDPLDAGSRWFFVKVEPTTPLGTRPL